MKKNNIKPIVTGASVSVRNGDVNTALRKLKKILLMDNRQKDLSRHEFYEKPSVVRKRARNAAKRKTLYANLNQDAWNSKANPSGLRWQKGRRSRRKVLDAQNALERLVRQQSQNSEQ